MALKLHGVPLSQPFRSVAWACVMKRLRVEVQVAVPGSPAKMGSRSDSYLKLSPAGKVPVLEDGDFALAESPAILEYLAMKHGWSELYPAEPAERASLSALMHWHHTNTRQMSAFLAVKLRPDLLQSMGADALDRQKAKGLKALELLENSFLASSPFLGRRSEPSIADLLVYEDVGPLGSRFTGLVDISQYPKVDAWCMRMEGLHGYDAVHASVVELGDISQKSVDPRALGKATKVGLKALHEAQVDA
ncbi:MAG: hypothetical protein SGPRY_000035 [Prymnesium sp.]